MGTGNDLARVLGWGSSCDDDAHLPQILERYESASTKMLDRWSIMVFEKAISMSASKASKMSLSSEQEALLTGMLTSANENLRSIVETDNMQILCNATNTLCETIDELLEQMCEHRKNDELLTTKCEILMQKLSMLLDALRAEESSTERTNNSTLKNNLKTGAFEAIISTPNLSLPPPSISHCSLL